jgi:hypothetical protein
MAGGARAGVLAAAIVLVRARTKLIYTSPCHKRSWGAKKTKMRPPKRSSLRGRL